MSAPLREILARFSVQMSGTEKVKVADTQVDGLIGRLSKLGNALAGSAIVYGLYRIGSGALGAASDAQEAMNVVRETFGQDAGGVQKWAIETGAAMSRAESDMIKMAGTMGAMLTPMLGGNTKASAEMSTSLAALAVDLRSFFNLASDEDALIKLRAGLSGEAEPMRTLGVNMIEANVAQFAHEKGLGKWGKTMSQATKTAIRYQYIMANTKIAQGDAIRTGKAYANSLQAVKGAFKALAEAIGNKIIPAAEGMLAILKKLIPDLANLVKGSYAFEAVMLIAAAATAKFAWNLAAANASTIVWAGGLALVVLAVEELIAAFNGEGGLALALDAVFGTVEKRAAMLEKAINGIRIAMAWVTGGEAAVEKEKARQAATGEARPGEDVDVTLGKRTAQRGIDARDHAVRTGNLQAYLTAPGARFSSPEEGLAQFKERRATMLHDSGAPLTTWKPEDVGNMAGAVMPAVGANGKTEGKQLVSLTNEISIVIPPGSNQADVEKIIQRTLDRANREALEASREAAEQ